MLIASSYAARTREAVNNSWDKNERCPGPAHLIKTGVTQLQMEAFGLQEVRERTMVVAGGLEEDAGWRLEAMKVICEEAELGPLCWAGSNGSAVRLDYRTPKEFNLPNQTINTIENLQL